MNFSILDCTLRDGGYYNNWDFDNEVVNSYLKAVALSGIEFVELGLRNFSKSGFLGAYAYTTEHHLNNLTLPEGPIYGVMVDAKTILNSDMIIDKAIEALFVPAKQSKIGLVRVAAHFDEVEQCEPIVTKLKEMGYMVGYNLMQAGGKPTKAIVEKAKQAASWGVLDVLYFADSLGNMDSQEVSRIINALRQEWHGPLGIHTHNNMGKGLDNTMAAIADGVTWVDSTITGMGRGAGNTQTENLLAVLDQQGASYKTEPVYDLVIRHFESMQKEYGWGSNLLYFLGAQNDIHPTYIQNLLSSNHFGTDEIVGAIHYLSSLEGTTSYNGSVLKKAVSFKSSTKEISGTDLLVGKFSDKEVLLVANGYTTTKYKDAIELYIKERNPIVISLNLVQSISEDFIDYFVISHNVKFLSDFKHYNSLSRQVILPKHRFSESELSLMSDIDFIDIGFDSTAKTFDYTPTEVKSNYDLTSAYALGLMLISKPSQVSLVGFDGYEKGDNRQQEMLDIFQQYKDIDKSIDLISLTPTSYPISQGSIYAIHK